MLGTNNNVNLASFIVNSLRCYSFNIRLNWLKKNLFHIKSKQSQEPSSHPLYPYMGSEGLFQPIKILYNAQDFVHKAL